MTDMMLHEEVADIFLKTTSNQSRYYYLVQCMVELSKLSKDAASYFINAFVHRELVQDAKLTLYRFKRAKPDE